jgi:hypothetical protein
LTKIQKRAIIKAQKRKGDKKMKHYYFIENNTGEEFLVGADTLKEAEIIADDVGIDIANNYGEYADVEYQYEMTEFEAENSGLDEY